MAQRGLKPKQLKKLHNARELWHLIKNQSNDYVAGNASDWEGITPTEMKEAIDRIVALLTIWRNELEVTDAGTLAGDYSDKP